MKLKNKFTSICIIFTLITVIEGLINCSIDGGSITYIHLIERFIVTVIGITSFYIYEWLEHLQMSLVTILHYLISLGGVFVFVWLTGVFIEPVSPDGYQDIFICYTLLFLTIGFVFEIKRRFYIKKQKKL